MPKDGKTPQILEEEAEIESVSSKEGLDAQGEQHTSFEISSENGDNSEKQQAGGNIDLIHEDLDINDMNFNFVKNSKSFKPSGEKSTQKFSKVLGKNPVKVGAGRFGVRRSEEDRY